MARATGIVMMLSLVVGEVDAKTGEVREVEVQGKGPTAATRNDDDNGGVMTPTVEGPTTDRSSTGARDVSA